MALILFHGEIEFDVATMLFNVISDQKYKSGIDLPFKFAKSKKQFLGYHETVEE